MVLRAGCRLAAPHPFQHVSGRMKVLVIDAALTSAMLVCQFLRKMGIEPLSARDGCAAIEAFKSHRPELVLVEASMPGMDGFEVAKRLRQLERDGEWTPIIFLVARTCEEDLERGIAVGGDDYLVKPIAELVLLAKVRAMQRLVQMRQSLVLLTRRLDAANRELLRLSSVDGLTGIANRRRFDDVLAREWARGIRGALPLSLLMCDVDHFKQYNDVYGHPGGDECLKAVAAILARNARRCADVAARYGGEEFALILPETDSKGAQQVGEQIRSEIRRAGLPHGGSSIGYLTLSIGVATMVPQRGRGAPAELLRAADNALYAAKQRGRDCVVVWRDATDDGPV